MGDSEFATGVHGELRHLFATAKTVKTITLRLKGTKSVKAVRCEDGKLFWQHLDARGEQVLVASAAVALIVAVG